MSIPIEEVARRLNVPCDRLKNESLLAYLAQQERLTRADIADLVDRYGVATSRDLKERIASGRIHGHPAWEDSIEWETLEAHLTRIEELRAQLAQDV